MAIRFCTVFPQDCRGASQLWRWLLVNAGEKPKPPSRAAAGASLALQPCAIGKPEPPASLSSNDHRDSLRQESAFLTGRRLAWPDGWLTADGLSCTRPLMRCPPGLVWKISCRRICITPWVYSLRNIPSGMNTACSRSRRAWPGSCFSRVARTHRRCVTTSVVCFLGSSASFEGSIHCIAGAVQRSAAVSATV